MTSVWAVVRVERWGYYEGAVFDSREVVAVYPDEGVAHQHRDLVESALVTYSAARRGKRTEPFKAWKAYDPGAVRGSDYSITYEVVEMPFRLHVDQFLEMNGE